MRLPNVQLDMRAERLEGPDSCVCVSEMTMRGEADVCRRELEKRDAHMRPDFPITLWHTEDPADYIIKLSYEHHFSTAPNRACERSRLILHFVGMRSAQSLTAKANAPLMFFSRSPINQILLRSRSHIIIILFLFIMKLLNQCLN